MTYPDDSPSMWADLEHQAADPEPCDYDPADALTGWPETESIYPASCRHPRLAGNNCANCGALLRWGSDDERGWPW